MKQVKPVEKIGCCATIVRAMSRVIVCKLGRLGELRKLLDCTTNNPISVNKLMNVDGDKDKDKERGAKRPKLSGAQSPQSKESTDTVGHNSNT